MSERESWMPSEEEIGRAYSFDEPRAFGLNKYKALAALIRRAAAKRALEMHAAIDEKMLMVESDQVLEIDAMEFGEFAYALRRELEETS